MYVVAFYSFRGGVGRTTALVHVGLELVRRGRKVLLVDFDLEAPDLTGYAPLAPTEPHPGMVEYVATYREQGASPDVTAFLYEVAARSKKGGRLWVMPAGGPGADYWQTLAGIDWQTLYERESGYLFFEDTRQQWQEQLHPDYVLIDTHAGITPALGIATRQLADAVVMMFTRHDDGLDELSRRIDAEAAQTGREPIEQLFVAAKVMEADQSPAPYYENEVGIFDLVASIPLSQRLLIGDHEMVPLHQVHGPADFETEEVYRDRLAQEYRRLANALILANYAQDRDGARVALCEIHYNPELAIGFSLTRSQFDSRLQERNRIKDMALFRVIRPSQAAKLDKIIDSFRKDADILAQAAACLFAANRRERALEVLVEAAALRPESPELLWQCASYRRELGDTPAAVKDLLQLLDARDPARMIKFSGAEDNSARDLDMVYPGNLGRPSRWFALPQEFPASLDFGGLGHFDDSDPLVEVPGIDLYVASAMRQIEKLAPERYAEAMQKPAVQFLPAAARRHLEPESIDHNVDNEPEPSDLVRSRRWADAITLLQPRLQEEDGWTLEDAFHLFIAWWGMGNEEGLRESARKAENRFLQRMRSADKPGVSDLQMMALVFWKIGKKDGAKNALTFIHEEVRWPEGTPIFSYWWLAHVSWNQFEEDCRSILWMVRRGKGSPPFLGEGAPGH